MPDCDGSIVDGEILKRGYKTGSIVKCERRTEKMNYSLPQGP